MKIKIIYLFILLGFITSCNEKILDKTDPGRLTTDQYYKNGAELEGGVNAIYGQLQGWNLWAREQFWIQMLRADEISTGGAQLEAARNEILTGVMRSDNWIIEFTWSSMYKLIHRSNVILAVADGVNKEISDDWRNRMKGEAQFFRGYAYFELATLYGGVPLYKIPVTSSAGYLPKETQDNVYNFAVADLIAAEANLPASYSDKDLGRATKGAAQGMLARLYLQMGKYPEAKVEALKVYNSGLYGLMDKYSDNFSAESVWNKESLFEVMYSRNYGGSFWNGNGNGQHDEVSFRSQEVSPVGWRNMVPSDKLLNEYEHIAAGDIKTDPRFFDSFYFVGDKYNNGNDVLTDAKIQGTSSTVHGITSKVSFRKYTTLYKLPGEDLQSDIDQRVIKFSEILTILAECEIETGTLTASMGYLNQLRNRPSVNMPQYPTTKFPCADKAGMYKALMHEKMVEFGGEEQRNHDILRWRKFNKLTSEPISYFTPNKFEFLPIPKEEIDGNISLKSMPNGGQNPGY